MKRSLIIGLTVCLFLALFTTSAFAINGPHKGPGFAADTDACAGCHRAHTGTASKLLAKGSTKYTFCTSCHNGSGANTNVETGIFEGDEDFIYEGVNSKTHGEAGKGLNGGGFVSAIPYTDRVSRSGPAVTLSGDAQRHDVTGGDTVTKAAFGGGDTGPTQDIANFTCVSCHDPHGTRNEDYSAGQDETEGTDRYRILRGTSYSKVNGAITANIKSNEGATPDYTKDKYKEGLAQFCVACHKQYLTRVGTVVGGATGTYKGADTNLPAGIGAEDDVVRHRHAADTVMGLRGDKDGIRGLGTSVWPNMGAAGSTRLPVEQPDGYSYPSYNTGTVTDPDTSLPKTSSTDEVTCMTCHQSHGSESTMTPSSKVSPADSSTLLRLDNRGVCEACHNK